jgi:hypothetical protein
MRAAFAIDQQSQREREILPVFEDIAAEQRISGRYVFLLGAQIDQFNRQAGWRFGRDFGPVGGVKHDEAGCAFGGAAAGSGHRFEQPGIAKLRIVLAVQHRRRQQFARAKRRSGRLC